MFLVDLADGAPQPFLGDYLLLLDLPPLEEELLRMEHFVGQPILHPADLTRRTRLLQLVSRLGRDVGLGANPKSYLGHLLSLLMRSDSEVRDLEVPIIQLGEL